MNETNYQNQPYVPMAPPMSPNVEPLKQFFNKPMFLILGIIGLVGCFFSGLYEFTATNTVDLSFLSNFGINTHELNSINNTPIFSLDIFSILTGVSFILFYVYSRQPGDKIKTPANILKVLSLISLVLCCILMGLLAIIVFSIVVPALIYQGSSYNNGFEGIIAVVILISIVCLFLFALIFIVSFAQYRFYKGIYKTITTAELDNSCATLVGILTVLTVVSSVTTIFTPPINIFGIISSLCQIAYGIMSAMFIFNYSSFIKDEKNRRVFEQAQQSFPQNPANNPYNYNSYPSQESNENPYASTPFYERTNPVCTNCGSPIGENDAFCINCGSPIKK